MPWYDYQCEKCGNVFEVQRPMGSQESVRCKQCGSTRTTKIFSPAGVHFKGSGFYVTDSSASGAKNPAEIAAPTDNGKADAKETVETTAAKPSTNGKKDGAGSTKKSGSTKSPSTN